MTRKEYIETLFTTYEFVRMLSVKEHSSLMLLKHRKLGRSIVVRSIDRTVAVFDFLNTITHPYIVEVLDVAHLDDGDVVLEEALDGETLDRFLSAKHFSYQTARPILKEIAEALSVIHNAGYVHRDVKPENIMRMGDGHIKLLDFDASRVAVNTEDTVRLGTVGFAAPEQFIGVSDRRADIYALGVLMNVMMTGHHPSEAIASHPKARYIIEKATMTNPDKRFRTAEEFEKAL